MKWLEAVIAWNPDTITSFDQVDANGEPKSDFQVASTHFGMSASARSAYSAFTLSAAGR